MRRPLALALVLMPSLALAQPPGRNSQFYPGPGPSVFPRVGFGAWPGYGWWGYPGAVGDFWSNGLSLYGPPVPTYGPIPGSFGGSDQRFMGPPGFGMWDRRRHPLPPRDPSVIPERHRLALPPELRGTPVPSLNLRPVPAPVSTPTPATLEFVLPPGATLSVNGQPVPTPDGPLTTAPLEPGRHYRYEVEATWDAGGTPARQSRTVTFAPGERVRVDLSRPE